jgi:WD40 repeat protein
MSFAINVGPAVRAVDVEPSLVWSADGIALSTVQFSPDDRLVASAGTIWSPPNRQSVGSFSGGGRVSLFSPSGGLFASDTNPANEHRSLISLWRMSDRSVVQSFVITNRTITCGAFSPDGTLIAAGDRHEDWEWDEPGSITMWRVSDGSVVRQWEAHPRMVQSVAFSPDGRYLVSTSGEAIVRIWDVATGGLVRTLLGHSGGVGSSAWSPDGRWIATGAGDSELRIWNAANGSLVRAVKLNSNNETYPTAFSPDSRYLASNGDWDTVAVWEVETGTLYRVFAGHSEELVGVAFSHDGRTLVSSSLDGTMRFWDLEAGVETGLIAGHTGSVSAVAISHDGRFLASAGGDYSYEIRLWSVADGRYLKTIPGPIRGATGLSFSPTTPTLAFGGRDGAIQLANGPDWSTSRVLGVHTGGVETVQFSPDGSLLAAGCTWELGWGPDSAKIWRVSDGTLVRAFEGHDGFAASVCFSPDSTLLAVANRSLRVWRVSDGTLVRSYTPDLQASSQLHRVQFLEGGRSIAVIGDQGILVYDLSRDDPVRTLAFSGDWPELEAVSPDGASLFGGGFHPRMVDPVDGGSLTLGGLRELYVSAADFSPEGDLIAFGDVAGRVGVLKTPVWMSSLSRDGNQTSVRWHGANRDYQLQSSADLKESAWENVGPVITNKSLKFTDGSHGRYYRVLQME